MDEQLQKTALSILDHSDLEELQKLLSPYLAEEDPFALYLSSRFSLAASNESEEEFAKRSIFQLKQASEGGVAQASYQMGVNHLYGDDVPQDYSAASKYFERAITQGHSYTKFTFGFSLFYGTDQNPKDEERGLALMCEAAHEGVEQAVQELELINETKNV